MMLWVNLGTLDMVDQEFQPTGYMRYELLDNDEKKVFLARVNALRHIDKESESLGPGPEKTYRSKEGTLYRIVKEKELTDKEYIALRKYQDLHSLSTCTQSGMIKAFMEAVRQLEEEMWDHVAELLDFPSKVDADIDNRNLRIDWTEKKVQAAERVKE
jgi:hypothetical protein